MASSNPTILISILFFLFKFAASTSISDAALQSHSPTSRSLLQSVQSCPVNLESKNYSIITSKCKGPRYLPELCCGALKEFACPFVDDINNLKTDCASTMFSYINLYGKYPPGLFAHECREGKQGLDCNDIAPPPGSAADDKSSGIVVIGSFPSLVIGYVLHFLVVWLL